MSGEILQTSSIDLEFRVAPEFVVSEEIDERFDAEQKFIDEILAKPPSEPVEDVGAVSHETNRIPDPRVLLVENGNISRLDGIPVDQHIEKTSPLGVLEYSAFKKIKSWASENNEGVAVWFSAPFSGIYPVSKVDFGEIRFSSDKKHKVLLKKAVLLDIDSGKLMEIANDFAEVTAMSGFMSPEQMRSLPKFCTRLEMSILLEIVSRHTDQTQMIATGEDLEIKLKTYERLSEHEETAKSENIYGRTMYYVLRRRAEDDNMIGEKSESCPEAQTAFQSYSREPASEAFKIIRCFCPDCKKTVSALIAGGRITCLSCGASAPCVC